MKLPAGEVESKGAVAQAFQLRNALITEGVEGFLNGSHVHTGKEAVEIGGPREAANAAEAALQLSLGCQHLALQSNGHNGFHFAHFDHG